MKFQSSKYESNFVCEKVQYLNFTYTWSQIQHVYSFKGTQNGTLPYKPLITFQNTNLIYTKALTGQAMQYLSTGYQFTVNPRHHSTYCIY